MKKLYIYLLILTCSITGFAQEIKLGDKVATFSGIDDAGISWKSTNVTSDFLVVYFYPAAMTGGCTKQACAYRDFKTSFDKLNTTIIGVSGDEAKNLKLFKESSQLNFPLISDVSGSIANTFGVPTTKGGSVSKEFNGENFLLNRELTTARWTFILDKNRKVIYKNTAVNAADDSKTVKDVIEKYGK